MPVETKISFSDGSSSETIRKLSDDLSRKHLSDLIEAEEDEVSSTLPERPRTHRKASTSSTFSVTSMDALWEKHPRRLSEAGLRRCSDHSVILTEDTDSFIIGERVWVGGSKPGQIAYIGETQFAPGDWAGIVLDEAIGKNDGSVAGVRYFQCSEKRGVFSRLTRLTRVPLFSPSAHDASPVSDAGSVFTDRPPSGLRNRRAISPNGSIVSSKMNASISTNTGELRFGDRVIVSSSRGSKAGTLRFVGTTAFATGVWAGVELDDPLGKNDGAVEGKRYFECAPRFGLFAPLSKVSRSPSNRKPGACAIHSNGRATPVRRSNSRESLTSLGTSIASSRAAPRLAQRAPRATSTPVSAKNALQELLREKQHHLERLMRERELERAEVAKVSLQREQVESSLLQLQKEAAQTTAEKEKLKVELEKLNKILEDERQKVEDLMFRTEEENINREDYNKYKEEMERQKASDEQRIRELEAEAALQSERALATSAALAALADQRNQEISAVDEQHREELVAAQKLQKLLDEAYALLKEKENEKDSLGKSMSEELMKVKTESDKALNEAKTKMAIAQTEFETQVSVLTAKLQLCESKLDSEKQNVERLSKDNSEIVVELNAKVAQLQATVDDKTHELNKVVSSTKEHEVNLNKEITKLKMELSAKVLDLDQLQESKKKQDIMNSSLHEEVNRLKEEYANKVNEYESLLTEASQLTEKSKTDIFELQQSLTAKTREYEKLLMESNSTTDATEKIVTEYKQTIHERDKEIIKLKDEYEEATANFNIKHSKIAEEHKKEIEDRNIKIEQLMKEIEIQKHDIEQSKVDFNALNAQFATNIDELKAVKEENERLKLEISELKKENTNLKEKTNNMELDISEIKRQRDGALEKCEELQKSKEKIESEYLNLTGQATDSNEQFNQLSVHLKTTEQELQNLKDKHREVINNHSRTEQELKQKLFKLQEDFSLERTQLVRSIDETNEKLKTSEIKIKDFEHKAAELNIRVQDQENNNDQLLNENSILKTDIENFKIKEQELHKEYDLMQKKLEVDIDRYKEEVSCLKADGATSEVKLMEKVDQLTEAQNDLNNKLEEARRHEDSLQQIVNDMTTQLNNQRLQYEKETAQVQTQLSSIYEESNSHRVEEVKLRQLLQEKETDLKQLSLKLEMLEVDIQSNAEIASEKEKQRIQIHDELSKVIDNKKILEEKLNAANLECSSWKQKFDNLVANSSAEESVLKEQLSHLETLKKDISVVVQEKTSLENKYSESTTELLKLKTEHEECLKKLQNNINTCDTLQCNINEKEALLKSLNENNEAQKHKLKAFEDEIAQLNEDLSTKSHVLQEKEVQLSELNQTLQVGTDSSQQELNQLKVENKHINDKYTKEIEILNASTKSLQSQITDQENKLEDLERTKEKVVELQGLLTKSESHLKQMTDINEGQKHNYDELNKQLQSEFDQFKRDSKRTKNDLMSRIEDCEKELNQFRDKVKLEKDRQTHLQQKLTEAEIKIEDLSNKLELAVVQNNSSTEKDDKLEKLTLEIQAIRKSSAETVANSEKLISNLRNDIEQKIKELRIKDDMILKLKDDLKSQKAKVEIVEREKVIMQKEMSTTIRDKNDNTEMGKLGQGDNATQRIEDKEMIDGQVSFLNSVIVDMQRKNEQLMARVLALEGGSDPEPLFNGRKTKAVAPRLFCDICEVFDAHDTEDCPQQEAEPLPPPVGTKPRPPPRPYCDICEVFGHSTENCDEEETF